LQQLAKYWNNAIDCAVAPFPDSIIWENQQKRMHMPPKPRVQRREMPKQWQNIMKYDSHHLQSGQIYGVKRGKSKMNM